LLGLLAACSSYESDIEKVKAAQSTGTTNEQFVKDLAGARGSFAWAAREAERYAADGAIVLVEATVTKTSRAGKKQVIQVQWLHNRETGKVAFEDVLVDGRSRGILGAALDILKLEFE
jgi:predicted hotdog family 3-hydroxylacyl-ACP dehydratase